MSIAQFNSLSKEESDLLYSAPALVTCLIAGAEDEFNTKEEEHSIHLVRIRANTGDPILFDYYKEVETNFESQLNALVSKFSNLQPETRIEIIVKELTKLNEILPKIDNLFARQYVKSLRTLAKGIAESSGGVLGFFSVSYEEQSLIGLDMISYED
jgi:hypothetical protein